MGLPWATPLGEQWWARKKNTTAMWSRNKTDTMTFVLSSAEASLWSSDDPKLKMSPSKTETIQAWHLRRISPKVEAVCSSFPQHSMVFVAKCHCHKMLRFCALHSYWFVVLLFVLFFRVFRGIFRSCFAQPRYCWDPVQSDQMRADPPKLGGFQEPRSEKNVSWAVRTILFAKIEENFWKNEYFILQK